MIRVGNPDIYRVKTAFVSLFVSVFVSVFVSYICICLKKSGMSQGEGDGNGEVSYKTEPRSSQCLESINICMKFLRYQGDHPND